MRSLRRVKTTTTTKYHHQQQQKLQQQQQKMQTHIYCILSESLSREDMQESRTPLQAVTIMHTCYTLEIILGAYACFLQSLCNAVACKQAAIFHPYSSAVTEGQVLVQHLDPRLQPCHGNAHISVFHHFLQLGVCGLNCGPLSQQLRAMQSLEYNTLVMEMPACRQH